MYGEVAVAIASTVAVSTAVLERSNIRQSEITADVERSIDAAAGFSERSVGAAVCEESVGVTLCEQSELQAARRREGQTAGGGGI
eukprot:CAMPEP_0206626254 /NCGR_PEP_ID=MMETSP0325_2-20121206/65193_1 /ASSEMBLY_ACC=CAM_ASM_000347 /TAXON_ID=2866 /ORGANISM="Crypthecodinium cohnii, Strain Seligo" /LENGTH=84 /DNA_ID=CAMNT_0054150537 /DNA_START=157 /DNA_END=411 /DNA_ORIENTATION=-